MTRTHARPAPDPMRQMDAYHELKKLALAVRLAGGSSPPLAQVFGAWIVLEAMAPDDYEVGRRAHGIVSHGLRSVLEQTGDLAPPAAVTLLHALRDYLWEFGGWELANGTWEQVRPPANPPEEPTGDNLPWLDPGYEHFVVTS